MEANESKALQLVKELLDSGIDGVGPLCRAHELAEEYLGDRSYLDNDSRVNSLICWEPSKNFGSGFVTGLGGLITLGNPGRIVRYGPLWP